LPEGGTFKGKVGEKRREDNRTLCVSRKKKDRNHWETVMSMGMDLKENRGRLLLRGMGEGTVNRETGKIQHRRKNFFGKRHGLDRLYILQTKIPRNKARGGGGDQRPLKKVLEEEVRIGTKGHSPPPYA